MRLRIDFGRLGAELLDQARIDVEFDDLALGVALEALVEGEVPAVAEAQHLERAAFGEVAADLLGDAHAHMLDDLLRPAGMRRDLGDRLEDEVQVADRDALGEQQLQHRLQARIGNLRRADVLDQPLVFRIEPVEQRAHVLVGEKLREVVADDFAEMREQDRHVVDRREAVAPDLAAIGFEIHIAFMPKAGSLTASPGTSGFRPVAGDDQHLADAHLLRWRPSCRGSGSGSSSAAPPGLGELDFRNDEAVLPREFPPHLGDAVGELAVRAQQLRRRAACRGRARSRRSSASP